MLPGPFRMPTLYHDLGPRKELKDHPLKGKKAIGVLGASAAG